MGCAANILQWCSINEGGESQELIEAFSVHSAPPPVSSLSHCAGIEAQCAAFEVSQAAVSSPLLPTPGVRGLKYIVYMYMFVVAQIAQLLTRFIHY